MSHHEYHANSFAKKTWGRIFVFAEDDIERVRAIIKELDPYEYESYLPKDLVGLWSEDAPLTYGHKFEADIDLITHTCWQRGIRVWIVDGHYSKDSWPPQKPEAPPET